MQNRLWLNKFINMRRFIVRIGLVMMGWLDRKTKQ